MNDPCPPHESRLTDLVGGLLPEDEARETMNHLRHCAECETTLRQLVAARESLRASPIPTTIDGRIQFVRPRGRRMARGWIAVAATVVLIGGFQVYRVAQRDEPLDYWISVSGEATVLRSTENEADQSGIGDALQSYREKDAAGAVEQLKAFTASRGDATAAVLRDLYLASALVNAGFPEDALTIVEQLQIQWIPTQWRYHAQWVRYLALVKAGRDNEARAWLETLAQEPGAISEKARAEIKRRRWG